MSEFDEDSSSISDGFRVNFSDKEAASEARGQDLLPRGNYHVKVTDGEIRESKSEKNLGKPYYMLECTIQTGQHEGRKLFTNVMLFDGALYTLVQIMKAMGLDVSAGSAVAPTLEEIIGNDFIVGVKKQGERTVGDNTYDARNEISSFMKYDPEKLKTGGSKASAGANSLMP